MLDMERVSFIVVEKSYLIRKGIVSIINRIERASVIKELETVDRINTEIQEYNPDFLVLNPNLIPHKREHLNFEIKLDLDEKGIALLTVPPYRKGMLEKFRQIIDIHESRETILEKIKNLVDSDSPNDEPANSSDLSDREKTILAEVARGLTNKEIADKLFLSTHTVITHRKNITNKLGIKTISGLTIYAVLNKLVDLNETVK
jgi:DNA-binding NarL/FixJ family response regulator